MPAFPARSMVYPRGWSSAGLSHQLQAKQINPTMARRLFARTNRTREEAAKLRADREAFDRGARNSDRLATGADDVMRAN